MDKHSIDPVPVNEGIDFTGLAAFEPVQGCYGGVDIQPPLRLTTGEYMPKLNSSLNATRKNNATTQKTVFFVCTDLEPSVYRSLCSSSVANL